MAPRFVEAHDDFIEELKHGSENKNTKWSTIYWTCVFKQWAASSGKNKKIDSYEVSRLYEALAQFFAELRKENGKEYSLRSKRFQSSYCVKIRARAKKKGALVPTFSTNSRGNAYNEGYKEYEPDSLKVMQESLGRYLRIKNYPKFIVRYAAFLSSRKALEGKARKLRELWHLCPGSILLAKIC